MLIGEVGCCCPVLIVILVILAYWDEGATGRVCRFLSIGGLSRERNNGNSRKQEHMIYSRFGSKLTLISKGEDSTGQLVVQATCEGMEGVRAYRRIEMTADDGNPEIDAALAKLPVTQK